MKDTIFVDMPVSIAKTMLDTEFGVFRSVENKGITLIRVTKPYSLPEEVAQFVALVDDIVRFPTLRRLQLTPLENDPQFMVSTDSTSASFSCGNDDLTIQYFPIYSLRVQEPRAADTPILLSWHRRTTSPIPRWPYLATPLPSRSSKISITTPPI